MPKEPTRQKTEKSKNHGIPFNKELGQHILKNPAIIDTIIDKAKIKPSDVILEIGPGTGNMTMKLLKFASKVVAVEFDKRMVTELRKRVQNTELEKKLEIIEGDILKVKLPYFDLCIANIPYQISSGIVFKLLSHCIEKPFRNCFLMFQREFALRLTATPNSKFWCRLSSNTQLLSKCDHIMKISKNSYRPPPKVDSSVVKITPKNPLPPVNFLEWDGLTRILFLRKNKKLHALFINKNILNVLIENYKTYMNLNNKQLDKDFVKNPNEFIKKKVNDIITTETFINIRPSKMENDLILKLLTLFNEAGIHFTSSNDFS